jgi:hypothetical protein
VEARLAAWTVPSTGLAGFNNVTDLAAGLPSGITAATMTVSFATTCGGAAVATENPILLTKVGPNYQPEFLIPGSLTAGTYYVTVSGSGFGSANCSEIAVTATTTTLAACVPTSSLAVVAGTTVTAYVPNGFWESGTTGIKVVNLEGAAFETSIATPGAVNSCAADSTTGEVICSENTANVDLITGSTLNSTVVSGSNAYVGFSGGECENCGVGVNAANHTAVIEEGYNPSPVGSAVQVLNLAGAHPGTFNPVFPLQGAKVSEDLSIDSGRNLILSPSESGYYELLKIGAGNALTEYNSSFIGGEMESAAEDCTTGIALASSEGSDDVYITDLTQATFTPGSPGSWTAPGGYESLNDGGYSAGTCGLSTAPGTGHLAVVTGEFGGNSFSALQLPATSGTGTPALVDWAYTNMPPTPDGNTFSAGYDPHTVTAYTSPNNNKSYGVFADFIFGTPNYVGVVDLACVLALPRVSVGSHIVDNSNSANNTATCVRYVATP